jgi:PAS domain S-box-containing protein
LERNKLATSAAKVGVWDWNIKTGDFYLDPNIKAILGYTDYEIPNDLEIWVKYVHPEDSKAVMEAAQACLNGKTSEYIFEHRMLHKNGSIRWILVRGKAIRDESGNAVRLIGTDADITDRKKVEEALRESEAKFKSIFENKGTATGIFGEDSIIRECNAVFEELSGYSKSEVIDKMKWSDFVVKEDLERMQKYHAQRLKNEEPPPSQYECGIINKNGDMRNVIVNVNLVGEDRIVSLTDITDWKQAEEALRESETRFRELFNSINDIVYTHDLNGRFISMNPALCRYFGYDEEELIGRRLSAFMKHEFADAFENEYLEKVKKDGHHEGTSIFFAKEGNEIYIEYRSSMVYPKEGNPYISGTGRDVTERILSERDKQKLQIQLTHAQKMESIGILAGGIAHNFNNILMGVQGRTSLMKMDKDPSHPDHEHLISIEGYVKNGVVLTRDLLGFARGGKYEVKPTDLNALIKHENRMFGRTKKEVRVQGKFAKNLWAVEIDQGQIRQALLNLYVNAWQAMPIGGNLYIQTENATLDEKYTKPFTVAPGKYVKVSVTDTGVGMDDVTREKIFDPFFSTKDVGQGSGLGLASVYGIIKNHGGFINVYSEKGAGSTFNIYLPASEREAVEEVPGPKGHDIKYGQGTVLFVDDEYMIVEVGQTMLEKLGYRVLTTGSGKEALDLYEKQKGEIDLVILDMIMPGIGGGETFDRLKVINGNVKVLLSSGYSIDGQAKEILDRGCSGFIQKPFSIEELSRKVREVLV